ncbi:MAG TPA: winged helix-turn-helix transcriptional regulator, partial [Candidatus Thermoplasmatota archaeon]|nr:winged helix-turn-helix transcriptional regulator [Candidatus Thermoplasmatota archaeon]
RGVTVRALPWAAVLLAALIAALPTASAKPADLFGEGGGDSLFDNRVAWGIGFGGAGLLGVGGLLYFLATGGLRHVDRGNVLEHPMRRSLLQMVEAHPGLHLRELASRHETAVTNTQWHLRKLEMASLVRTQKLQGRRVYYPVQGGMATRERAIQNAALQNPNAERLRQFLEAHAGCNQRSLAEALSMNPGTVRWHLRKLETAGVVRSIQEGAQTRYFLMQRPPRPAPASLQAEAIAPPVRPAP